MKKVWFIALVMCAGMIVSPITATASEGNEGGTMEAEGAAEDDFLPSDGAESDCEDFSSGENGGGNEIVIDANSSGNEIVTDADGGGNEIVIDVDSGAARDDEFISVNETVQTDSGPYDLIMYGLKEGNKEAVIDALEENYDPGGGSVLTLVDDAIADAEKYDSDPVEMWNSYDSRQCWAASAANMLWMAGWAEEVVNPDSDAPFTSEDEVFAYFNDNFSDQGAEVSAGINWFFTGEFYNPGYTGAKASLLRPKDPENGLMKEFASMQVQEKLDLIENPADIARLADCDWTSETPAVFQASIGGLTEGKVNRSQHSVTVAGVVMDAVADQLKDIFKSILIIDSDNDAVPSEEAQAIGNPTKEQKNADKAARPNSVSLYNLALIADAGGTPCWQLLGYDSPGPEIIYALNRLPLYSSDLIRQNTEAEGTKNIVENVDLKFGTAFTTGETERIIDLYGKDEKELTKTEFRQGEPVNVSYFVANMGSSILTETYTGEKPLTVDWRVVREADREVVAKGRDSCELPIYGGLEFGFMSRLNRADGELQAWKPGTYTLYLDLNADRNVEEAYYLNNVQKEMTFTILGESEEPGEADPVEPEEIEPEEIKPEEIEPGEIEPGEIEPEEIEPGDAGKPDRTDTAEENGKIEDGGEADPASNDDSNDAYNESTYAGSPETGDGCRPLLWLITAISAVLAGCLCGVDRQAPTGRPGL